MLSAIQRLQTLDCLQTSDFGLWSMDFGLWSLDYGLRIFEFGLSTGGRGKEKLLVFLAFKYLMSTNLVTIESLFFLLVVAWREKSWWWCLNQSSDGLRSREAALSSKAGTILSTLLKLFFEVYSTRWGSPLKLTGPGLLPAKKLPRFRKKNRFFFGNCKFLRFWNRELYPLFWDHDFLRATK